MDRADALAIPDQAFLDALTAAPTVSVWGLDGGDLVAIYDRAGDAGTLVGVRTEADWLALLEQHSDTVRKTGVMADQFGNPPDTVADAKAARSARLQVQRDRLAARVAVLDARLAE